MEKNKIKVVELFSGIGAQSKALTNLGVDFEVVGTADWDIFANISYACTHHNQELKEALSKWEKTFSEEGTEEFKKEKERLIESLKNKSLSRDGKNLLKSFKNFKTKTLFILEKALELNHSHTDIKELKGIDLPNHDILTYSFPCQDLSLQGSQKGLHEGKSSSMLWEVGRILKELNEEGRLPKYLVMENVKSLFSEKYSIGFNKWKETLMELGYTNHEFVFNSKNFGVPQNRERAFMVSELNQNKFIIPTKGEITEKSIGDFLDNEYEEWNFSKGEVTNWTPERNKNGLAKSKIENYSTFQSEAMIFGKNSISPTITATGALNRIKVIEKEGTLRMLTSKEQWQLMGFDKEDWEKVNEFGIVPEGALKKQAGNSIVVQVLESIFRNIINIEK